MIARSPSVQQLVTAFSARCPASSRSNHSIDACTDRVMAIVQSRVQTVQYQVAGPAGVLVESETLGPVKPEGEVSWKLGGTTGCFWIALQRRRHQMAGWVVHGMAVGTLQPLPRSKVRHDHGGCRRPMSLCPVCQRRWERVWLSTTGPFLLI